MQKESDAPDMDRQCDKVRVRHVRCPPFAKGDLRERGNDPVLDQGVVHDLSVRALQERLAELERSEKEQSAETAQEFEFCARLEKQPEARRRHWSPTCSRKWRLSRVCT